jgi:hypothetical protein
MNKYLGMYLPASKFLVNNIDYGLYAHKPILDKSEELETLMCPKHTFGKSCEICEDIGLRRK